ncbi:MAG: cell division protein ZapA [Pseudomonadota bacterium]
MSVLINGKSYRMACDEGQEAHLEALAAELDKYVNHLKGSFGDIGDQRLTVMAGVMVTDEMLELKKKLAEVEKELASLKDQDVVLNRERQAGDEELSQGINEAAQKIEELSRKMTNVSS